MTEKLRKTTEDRSEQPEDTGRQTELDDASSSEDSGLLRSDDAEEFGTDESAVTEIDHQLDPDAQPACLTLDLENDWYLDDPAYDHLTLEYLDEFIALVADLDVPLTVFVVGQTLEKYPEAIDRLRTEIDCEFHLHSYQHDTDKDYEFRTEIRQGVEAFREYFGRDPIGYRAPQGNIEPKEFRILEEEGFTFDSSVFPSYRPGVYNNLEAPTEPYVPDPVEELVEIPIGTTSLGRVPTAQSYLKLFGRPYLTYLRRGPLPEVLVYNVHLQDLYRTDSHDELPTVKRKIYNRNMSQSESLLADAVNTIGNRGYEMTRMTDVVNYVSATDAIVERGDS